MHTKISSCSCSVCVCVRVCVVIRGARAAAALPKEESERERGLIFQRAQLRFKCLYVCVVSGCERKRKGAAKSARKGVCVKKSIFLSVIVKRPGGV